ncbi:hypothetical protein BC936DRAFT_139966 [Jimgerdemannia flammicorona]|uniref:Uncharacterized protein n=2 Tax=Jimgerdemannia flammicorona TaxID=994334 RepID=A0A433DHD0_9FUNG|nr:hypothetical protein BC936DRAFT_139966 [Jimgerdemannia flammicorona]RUS35074.1 hypothetical protein BC938DRAFT_476202 [Jimgerdemannia flammicorona]
MGPKRATTSQITSEKASKKPKSSTEETKKPARAAKKGKSEPKQIAAQPPPATSATPIPSATTFLSQAKPMHLKLYRGSKSSSSFERDLIYVLDANPKRMTTGSYGWSATGKTKIRVGTDREEAEVPVQITVNIVVPGSKTGTGEEVGEAERENGEVKEGAEE